MKHRIVLSAAAFLFSLGAGAAFAYNSSCVNYCKMELESCFGEGAKAGCVAMYKLCRAECGA